MCLDSGVGGIGGRLVRHRHPCAAVPPFRRVSATGGVDPQGSRLAHRSVRRSGLDEHVGLAVSHASGGGSSRIRLLRGIGRVRGGLCRTVGGGFRLRGHTRRIRGGGLGVGRIGLRGGSVRFGGIGRSIGRVRQCLGIASGLLRALGGGLRGVGGALRLTCGRGRALGGSGSRIGGILRGLRRTIGRVSCALSVLGGGSGILGGLLGVGGLRGVIRNIRLRLSDFVGIALHVGIAQVVPSGTIPDKRLNHAIRQRHERGRRIIGFALPVRVKVGQEARAVVFLAFPPRPIFLGLEPQVTDDQIVLRLVRPTESVIL